MPEGVAGPAAAKFSTSMTILLTVKAYLPRPARNAVRRYDNLIPFTQ
jgi:hypothetical protein